jgi:hypothetical protein
MIYQNHYLEILKTTLILLVTSASSILDIQSKMVLGKSQTTRHI